MSKRIFLALPVTQHGTADEATIIDRLGKDWEVVSPNTPEHSEAYRAKGIEYFDDVVRSCDAIAFQHFPDGSMGAGIAKQVEVARQAGMQIFVVSVCGPGDQFLVTGEVLQDADLGPVLTVEETRAKIAAIRAEREAA